jgi:hypothetical protein
LYSSWSKRRNLCLKKKFSMKKENLKQKVEAQNVCSIDDDNISSDSKISKSRNSRKSSCLSKGTLKLIEIFKESNKIIESKQVIDSIQIIEEKDEDDNNNNTILDVIDNDLNDNSEKSLINIDNMSNTNTSENNGCNNNIEEDDISERYFL